MYYKEKRKIPLVFEFLKVCLKWKLCFKYNINRHQSLFIILLVIKIVENVSISIKFIYLIRKFFQRKENDNIEQNEKAKKTQEKKKVLLLSL